MKILTFNVNSIRARLHQLAVVVERHNPDFIVLQETKVTDGDFPAAAVEELGYHAVWHGQKTHFGVATLSRRPHDRVRKGLPGDDDGAQRRLISTTFDLDGGQRLLLVNGYFPQGESRDHPIKFPNKRDFYARLTTFLEQEGPQVDFVVVAGDMNVAPGDLDVGIGADNARRWLRTGKCSFLPEERSWLQELQAQGLVDCHRALHPDVEGPYSWFDYRSRGFDREPKRGLRIDLILGSESLVRCCTAAGIDYDVRAMERPSDHAPVWAEFDLAP